jgi:ubiquinone/menaquinone biosynthesis C-methylase UbiE
MNNMGEESAISLANLRRELAVHLEQDRAAHFGNVHPEWIHYAEDYFWDESHQAFRILDLERYGFMPGLAKVLDLAGGCGQFLLFASKAGYDCWALEPEAWKLEFVRDKIRLMGFDATWSEKMTAGVGERIPFDDNFFDCVSTYQTLEHVDDPHQVLSEMIRVTKVGGGIYIRCPDYRSTFEAHYQLPWLPLFPRGLAKCYLALLGRPTKGLDTIRYVTKRSIENSLAKMEKGKNLRVMVIDDDRVHFMNALRRRRLPALPGLYETWLGWRHLKSLFKSEQSVNLFVRVVAK